ncbi:MAG: DUF1553 domain-containing protein [Victivallales bacterium]
MPESGQCGFVCRVIRGRIAGVFRAENGNNAPFNPELLAYLEQEFKDSNYSIRHLYRTILNSETGQRGAMNCRIRSPSRTLLPIRCGGWIRKFWWSALASASRRI